MPDFSMWGYRTQYVDACTLHSRLKARVADLEAGMPYIAEEDQHEALARLEADLAAGVSAGPGRSSRPPGRRWTASIICPPSAGPVKRWPRRTPSAPWASSL